MGPLTREQYAAMSEQERQAYIQQQRQVARDLMETNPYQAAANLRAAGMDDAGIQKTFAAAGLPPIAFTYRPAPGQDWPVQPASAQPSGQVAIPATQTTGNLPPVSGGSPLVATQPPTQITGNLPPPTDADILKGFYYMPPQTGPTSRVGRFQQAIQQTEAGKKTTDSETEAEG